VTLRHGASLNILSLAAIDRLTFLATTYDGIRKSMDGGRSWFAVGGPWGRARVRSLSILPGDPAVILAGTDAGVFRSENGGEIWELVTAKPVSVEAVYATARPGSTTLALTSDGLFFSSDRGRGWTRAEKPYGTDLYDVALHRENFILAATSRGLYRSTDQAKTWQLVKGTLGTGTVRAVCIHPTKSLAFAAQQSTVYMTADGGSTWSALPSRGLERCLVQALVINPETPDWLYALAKGRGVFALPLTDASARR
jgi:photosystem II stability/assembly factor-like uncharacterized protein